MDFDVLKRIEEINTIKKILTHEQISTFSFKMGDEK